MCNTTDAIASKINLSQFHKTLSVALVVTMRNILRNDISFPYLHLIYITWLTPVYSSIASLSYSLYQGGSFTAHLVVACSPVWPNGRFYSAWYAQFYNLARWKNIKWVREAFKKIREIFHLMGGWSKIKNFMSFKVMFKIHFRPFWVILLKMNLGEKRGGSQFLILVEFQSYSYLSYISKSISWYLYSNKLTFDEIKVRQSKGWNMDQYREALKNTPFLTNTRKGWMGPD